MGAIFNLFKPIIGLFNKVGMQAITKKTSPLAKTAVLFALATNLISKDVAEFIMIYLNNISTEDLIKSSFSIYLIIYIHGFLWAIRKKIMRLIEGDITNE